jgi:Calcineurin-like phosphoesterase
LIAEVLSRGFLLKQLPAVKDALARLAAEPSAERILAEAGDVPELARAPELDASDYERALASIEAVEEAGVLAPSATEGVGEGAAPIEEVSFFSRDPVTSLIQSALELHIETMHGHAVAGSDQLPPGRCPEEGDPLPPTTGRELIGPFEPADLGWVAFIVAWGLRGPKRPFNPNPAPPVTLPDRARVLVVGDWGTGIERAQAVACHMRRFVDEGIKAGLEQHVVHLGDVYYAGWDWEYDKRFIPYWPVRLGEEKKRIYSWSLNGNHDMYSGGEGYFDRLLADPRFGRQAKSSWFRLENDHWRLFGLDTAWDEVGLMDSRDHFGLQDPQADTIMGEIAKDDRKVMLLSHHQLFSCYPDRVGSYLGMKLKTLLESDRVDAWLWGHEHKAIAYEPFDRVNHGSCLGHGGVPVYRVKAPKPGSPVRWYESGFRTDRFQDWALFGFAVLDLDGPHVRVRYIDEYGRKRREDAL